MENSENIQKNSKSDEFIRSNLTDSDFIINKAEINIETKDSKLKAIAVIKFKKDSAWLVSIKSIAGIEIARALITKDSLKVNDRINRAYYYGRNDNLTKKFYGLSFWNLPIILGDIEGYEMKDINTGNCVDGKLEIKEIISGHNIEYRIDCRKKAWLQTNIRNVDDDKEMLIKNMLSGRKEKDGKRKIFFQIVSENMSATLLIKRVSTTSTINLSFIPGKDFERKLLK